MKKNFRKRNSLITQNNKIYKDFYSGGPIPTRRNLTYVKKFTKEEKQALEKIYALFQGRAARRIHGKLRVKREKELLNNC